MIYLRNRWEGTFVWDGRKRYRIVGGTEAAPDPALLAALVDLVARFTEVTQAIEAFAMALPPDTHIWFKRRPDECFAARICGFVSGNLFFDGVTVDERPGHALVGFVTGDPDGYVSYEAVLEDGRPVEIYAVV